jgi:hypothetical protein
MPAILLDGITVVCIPFRSIMDDYNLKTRKNKNFKAAYLHGDMTKEEVDVINGKNKLVGLFYRTINFFCYLFRNGEDTRHRSSSSLCDTGKDFMLCVCHGCSKIFVFKEHDPKVLLFSHSSCFE